MHNDVDGSFDEAVVVRYLLGDLPEETQVRIEDRAFSDPAYLQAIEAVEADLIDDYVHGHLTAVERRQFEDRFLASPERRKKVEFSKALARVVDESREAQTQPTPAYQQRRSWRETLAEAFRGRVPAFQLSMAALALLLVGVLSWQLALNGSLRGSVGKLQAEQRAEQDRERSLQQKLDQEHARAEQLAADASRQKGSTAQIASLMLLPGMVRGGNVLPEITVPVSAQLVRLEIQLEAHDEFPAFKVDLKTSHGEEVLTRSGLRALSSAGGRSVVLEVPASALVPGQNDLTLVGINGADEKDIGYYRFSVKR
jgi:hypothetical protein